MRVNYRLLLLLFLVSVFGIAFGQNNTKLIKQQKVITSFEKQYTETETTISEVINNSIPDISVGKEAEINWQFTDPGGILSKTLTNGITKKTLGDWELNDKRISLYGNTSTPEWESAVISEWSYPIAMTPDGQFVAYGADAELKVFTKDSPTPIWDFSFVGIAEGLCLSPDGLKVYVAFEGWDGVAGTRVACYNVGDETPVWENLYTGNNEGLVMNEGGTTLILVQYGGENSAMRILNAETGNLIMNTPNQNQNLPAISHDAKIIVRGDYSGYLYVYEYDDANETYSEKWSANINSGTGTWVTGISVSGDGSTIAAGSLVFTSDGYDGELYVFNTYSSTYLWKLENLGDMITSTDLSYDGSILGATGYGPMDNNKPDFYLFRKNSSNPYFTYSTSGSMFSVDVSEDGLVGSFGGKMVHAREMGSGGYLFSVNCDLGGGVLAGTVDLINADDNDGVKINIPELDAYYDFSTAEGDYLIKYIPEGSYTVVASKVGYYPVTYDDVSITEGLTTTLDFEMEATGNPPTNLMATKGANLAVELVWEAPETRDYIGFNIYRKTNIDEAFPEEPLGQVAADQLNYVDVSALPTIHYFYSVTADFGDDVQSPYSNVDEGWTSTGFVTNVINVYDAVTIPIIDGVISEGEWDDAFRVDCSDFLGTYDNNKVPVGSVMGYFKMNSDNTEMYVAYYNLNDTDMEDHDEVALYIDDNGDGSFPPEGDDSEGNYWAAHYASGDVIKYRPIHDDGSVGEVIYLDNPQIAASVDAGYMVYEFVIPMGSAENWQLAPGSDNYSTLGIFVLNDPSDFEGWWPYDNTNLFAPTGFGTMNYNAIDEIPPAPEDLSIELFSDSFAVLDWNMAPISDFDYYNVYLSEAKSFEILGSTIGNQYFYELPHDGYYQFYVTTVDNSGQESEPSEIVDVDFYVGVQHQMVENIVSAMPNPFKEQITFSFFNKQTTNAVLQIVDVNGKNIRNLLHNDINIGEQSVSWDGRNEFGQKMQPGIYFYRLILNDSNYVGKIILGSNF